MKIIADSSSTRTEWALVDGDTIVEHAFTQGLNPYFQSRRDISHSIRLEIPDAFFKRRWSHIYFYGAGCANLDKRKIMEASLIAQFKTPATVESDLLGAARGLLVRDRGIACILGTGSNSCLYDGSQIVKSVRSAGFILGDEGSGAQLGKMFVSDCLKNIAPVELKEDFYARFGINPDAIMNVVYTQPFPNRSLSTYSFFLAKHLDNDYVVDLITRNIRAFFNRNIVQYDYQNEPIAFVGLVAYTYADILKGIAAEFGVEINKIVRNSMPGLLDYHRDD
ncbi:MAG: hypothetical protein ACI4A8_03585 [Muribaculaceae bacterium]